MVCMKVWKKKSESESEKRKKEEKVTFSVADGEAFIHMWPQEKNSSFVQLDLRIL